MISGHYFRRIDGRRPNPTAISQSNNGTSLALVCDRISERFTRITGLNVLAIPLDLSRLEDAEDPPGNPNHPACAEFAQSDYCRESWQLHLAELRRRPEAHWHTCDYGRLCAVVPVVYQERCLAAVKFVCPNTMAADSFARHVELLDVLVENLVIVAADSLARVHRPEQGAGELTTAPSPNRSKAAEEHSRHPQVFRAIEYIQDHLSDSKLSVRRTARKLDLHPDYLAHLFSVEVGQHMSKFIATRRVELAKTLLSTTDWQVKRVAGETGHANPNWFSHVFRVHTGLTPIEYRRKAYSQQRSGSNRGVASRGVVCRCVASNRP